MIEVVFPHREHELVKTVDDPGLLGYLVIDSTIGGRSCGGLRISSTVSLQEVKDLATAMTLKQAFLGIPRGGAKAAIVASDSLSAVEKECLVKEFGEQIADLLRDRRYLSGPDMGTTSDLIDTMGRHIGLKTASRSTGTLHSAYFTSLSVLVAIETSLAIKGLSFVGATFAI